MKKIQRNQKIQNKTRLEQETLNILFWNSQNRIFWHCQNFFPQVLFQNKIPEEKNPQH